MVTWMGSVLGNEHPPGRRTFCGVCVGRHQISRRLGSRSLRALSSSFFFLPFLVCIIHVTLRLITAEAFA